jgi:3-hydroxyisobutyrate dehydrogenase-like beta-hydroxyacid dehydrogenase
MNPRVGFIGLGAMGKPMAANIARAGFELTVCDLREEPCKELAALGATVVPSPREVAERSDIIEMAVVDDAQAEQVVTGEHGVIHGAPAGSIVAIHSTILPATARKIAARCSASGVAVIDVPMSGGQKGAEEQRLAYMAGGEAAALEKCWPVFVTSAKHIFHLGELGMGATAKMLIQIVVCLNMVAAHESELLCDKIGLDFKKFQEVLHVSSGQSRVLDTWQQFKRPGESEAVRRHRAEVFAMSLAPALELAREVGASLPGTALAQSLLNRILDVKDN